MSNQTPSGTGPGTSSSWNDSAFAFAPNTNVLDENSMPSEQAQAARDKAAQVMAALKSGDTERANALMGKDETKGKILPGMGWIKKKLNRRGEQPKVEGVDVAGGVGDGLIFEESGKSGKGKDEVIR